MEMKKAIIKDIEKSLQQAMSLLWDVEKKYGDVHHVMNILKDGNTIVQNAEGALLKLTIERYFEKHGDETDFNDIKKAINDISDAKLKIIGLQEKIIVEEQNQSQRVTDLERGYSELKNSLAKIKKEMPEKVIDVEIPEDQEMDITLRTTPVKVDLFKTKIEEKYKDWSQEDWDAFRGEIIAKRKTLHIRKNVAKEVEENLEKGPKYIMENVIAKYYPFSKKESHSVYAREYYKHFKKEISIPSRWIKGKKGEDKKIIEKSEKDFTLEENVEEAESEIRKRFEDATSSKITKKIKGRKITDKIAKRINKTYSTTLTYNRYEAVLKAVYSKPKETREEYKKMVDFSISAVYAHLRYGVEIGDIKSKNKRYALRENGIKKAEKLFPETKVNESKTVEKEKKRDATIGKNQRYESLSMLFDEKYGKKITDDVAKKMEKKYHYSVRAPTLSIIFDDIRKNPGTSMKEVRDRTGFSAVKTNVHIQYGLETERLLAKDFKYYIVEGMKPIEKEMEPELKKEKEEKIVTPKVQLEGTPITDIIAQNIHIKYGSPVIKERYQKLKNILESAILYKRTIQELSQQTGWSKHNVYIHMLYGCNKKINEISECGENEKGMKQYCLAKNKDKVIKPKEVKVKSKSWLKWK